jgi:UDP-N-acetyl-D-galactosamine dehydrogenase
VKQLFEQLKQRQTPIAVLGLGYVGLPLAVHLAKAFDCIGFDIKSERVARLQAGVDDTFEVENEVLQAASIRFTSDARDLDESRFIVVAVPTPIDDSNQPDLGPLRAASRTIGEHVKPGTVIVFESTVYPGVTEDVCGPIIAETSGLICGRDFYLAYSPERINPGDKKNTFDKIVKVVSGQTPEVTELVARVYGQVVTAGVHQAPSIKTAEAAKVIENTQRDLNIALMNELSMIFNKLDLDTHAVLEAAGTKWNFLPFQPGLVGGHCIGVDPYYLTYLAQKLGHHPRVILSGRMINDGMSKHVAEQTVKRLIKAGVQVKGSRVLVLGVTFKENVPDTRNSRVVDLIHELRDFEVEVLVHDAMVTPEQLRRECDEEMADLSADVSADAIILAVKHDAYLAMDLQQLFKLTRQNKPAFIDVKAAFDPVEARAAGFDYWSL